MMRDLFNALPLPDNRPITSLCIVEDVSGCPPNYTVVSKTHDQDIDADLAKDGFFKRVSRYLCHSKTEGFFGYVVENILILNDKDSRPPGYTILEQTIDSNQKTFRKKQLCYKAVPRNMATQTITDIIILGRSKVAPEGFTLFGEMNGLSICFKPGAATGQAQKIPAANPLPYGMNPNDRGSISSISSGGGGVYPSLDSPRHIPAPSRQAPLPPVYPGAYHAQQVDSSNDAIYDPAHSSLSGVPFIMNKQYVETPSASKDISSTSSKSGAQIENEYYYSFALEQDLLNRTT